MAAVRAAKQAVASNSAALTTTTRLTGASGNAGEITDEDIPF